MRYMTVTAPSDDDSIPGVESTSSGSAIVDNYPVKEIDESVNYDTGETGENYKGSAKLKGQLNADIEKGHVLEDEHGKYKIITVPELGKKWLRAELIKLS